MRNRLSIIFLITLLFGSTIIIAQPTLTSAINPQIGDNWVYSRGTPIANVMPGPAGVNQNWDFSAFVSDPFTSDAYISCSSTPNCSSYPAATVVRHEVVISSPDASTYYYYMANDTAYTYLGGRQLPSGATYDGFLNYTDPEEWLKYPMTYNDTYTASWHGEGTLEFPANQSGNSVVTADAYGTITLPGEVFSDVLRIHRQRVYTEIEDHFSSVDTTYVDEHSWTWYSPTKREYVFQYNEYNYTKISDGNINSGTTKSAYITSLGLGTNDLPVSIASNIKVFPVPTAGQMNLLFDTDQNKHISVTLQDMTGRTVAIVANQDFAAGSHQVSLDVSNLPAAIYALTLRAADGQQVTQRVQIL